MDGLYVFNNPWSVQANEKHTTYCAMMQLGMPIPETWMMPPKAYEPTARPRSRRCGATRKLFDLGEVGKQLGYPLFMKPYDGGGWGASRGSTTRPRCARATTRAASWSCTCRRRCTRSTRFVRCIGLGPQTHLVNYDPGAPLHDRYTHGQGLHVRRRGADPARHHADDQRVLRLGLQLVRGAAQGRRLVSDRLRQRLPGLAGHVAALPLPVAGQGQHALVDLLRRHQAEDAQEPRLGAVLRDRAAATCRTARGCASTPRSRAALRRPRSSRSSARSTWRTSTRSPGSSSARPTARDAVRKKVAALFPAHEVESSPSCSGGGSGVARGPYAGRPGAAPASRGPRSNEDRRQVALRAARARGHPGALGQLRPAGRWCSRPPAATPRRSSACTWSARCAR